MSYDADRPGPLTRPLMRVHPSVSVSQFADNSHGAGPTAPVASAPPSPTARSLSSELDSFDGFNRQQLEADIRAQVRAEHERAVERTVADAVASERERVAAAYGRHSARKGFAVVLLLLVAAATSVLLRATIGNHLLALSGNGIPASAPGNIEAARSTAGSFDGPPPPPTEQTVETADEVPIAAGLKAIANRPTPKRQVLGDTLRFGVSLHEGDILVSSNGRYELWVQSDGNVVVYKIAGGHEIPIWSTKTAGDHLPPFRLTLQSDANVVLRGARDVAAWASHTSGDASSAFLKMQTDGNLVLYASSGKVLWASNTVQPD